MTRLPRSILVVLVGALTLSAASCRRNDRRPTLPTSGSVFYRGKPAEGAQVTLVPLDDTAPKTPRPGGQVRRDGWFRLSTYISYDGAPAGRYAVTIVYPSPSVKEDNENAGPDLLRGRYADPKVSPLTVDIKPGATELPPFDLK